MPATAGRKDASVQAKIDAMRHVVNLPMVLAAQQVSCTPLQMDTPLQMYCLGWEVMNLSSTLSVGECFR